MAKTPRSVKSKGSRFEREIGVKIEEALGRYKIWAKRTPMSGAIQGWRGDITTNLPVCIECKNVEKLNFREAFRQAESAATGNQIPLLLTSKNYTKQVIAVMDFEDLLTIMDWALKGGWHENR